MGERERKLHLVHIEERKRNVYWERSEIIIIIIKKKFQMHYSNFNPKNALQ